MPLFEAISAWLKATLLPFGGFGLMILAICDSSFISLPEVNDLLLMTFSIDNPARMPELAILTTLGSVIGCALLYSVGRKGGEAFLQKRFSDERMLRIRQWYQKYGILAVIVPSLLPPPTPFKIFVLSAGTFGISWPKFLTAVVIGRGLRYFSEGFLAITYGPAAITFVHNNYGKIGIALSALIISGVIIYIVAKKRMRSVAVVLALGTLLSSGCISRTVKVPADQQLLPGQIKTRAELLSDLEVRSKAISTMTAKVALDLANGGRKTDEIEEYRQATGIIMVDRPKQVRLRVLAPVIATTVADMVSDGKEYRVSVPIKNKFMIGDADAPPTSANALMNLRPQHILDALFVDIQPYLNNDRIGIFLEEATNGRIRYYVLTFVDIAERNGKLREKIWVDRTNLQVTRKQIFRGDGILETDVQFSGYQNVAETPVPQVISIQRPIENYSLKITFQTPTVKVNEKLSADTFLLERPAGAELVQTANPGSKPF
jgi:membrane protein YqaA with SNARE-associated domain/outer membrane lipoprotein-sorting protein